MNIIRLLFFLILFDSFTSYANEFPFDGNVKQLQNMIKEKSIKTFDQAIDLFSEDYFSPTNYRVFYISGSPQGATETQPRIILFGKESKLRIGFNHRISQKKSIELLEYNKNTKEWELSEIEFKKNKVHFSKINPSRCTGCHNSNKQQIVLPNIDRNNPLSNINIFSKLHTNTFLKTKDEDPIYSKLKFLNL